MSEFIPLPSSPEKDGVSPRLVTFKRLLSLLSKGRLLDLATGHGRFAQLGRSLGWKVTAVDARHDRFPDDQEIEWVQCDIKDFDVSGYDCIAVLGLLYHLDDPMALLERCGYAPTILDTHMAPKAEDEVGGYGGQWMAERNGVRSAFSNPRSFVPTHRELIRMLNRVYGTVLEATPSVDPGRNFFLCLPKS